MSDPVRLAFGTLTVIRVPAPARVDGAVAGRAMVLAPLVGLVVSVPVTAVAAVGLWAGVPALLCATAAVTVLAALSRGLHLDGLADTADGLGSGRSGDQALAVMSRSDIGPFGVVTLVLTLMLQVAALAALIDLPAAGGHRWVIVAALPAAVVTSRAALTRACRRGMAAAKPSGLGALVASTVSRPAAIAVPLAVIAAAGAGGWLAAGVVGGLVTAAGSAMGLVSAGLLTRRCRRRFGGQTGDTLGASVEVAMTAGLVAMAVVWSALATAVPTAVAG